MSYKILVLGCGLVGKHIVTDLAEQGHEVVAYDYFGKPPIFDEYKNITFVHNKVEMFMVPAIMKEHLPDIVVNALPGHVAFNILEAVLECDDTPTKIVDISFMPEDPMVLSKLAEKQGVVVVTDFGIAPGVSHGALASAKAKYPDICNYQCFVGGMPHQMEKPWFYKAPFSPRDVIEEYTRPARYMLNQMKELEGEPLFNTQYINIPFGPAVGKEMQAFLSDGLRSLITSFPDMTNMTEWTIRHEEHLEKMQWLFDHGFFGKDVIEHTAKTLINGWTMHEQDRDWLYMKIIMDNGTHLPYPKDHKKVIYEIYDEYTNGVPAMARTTGYACNAVIEYLMGDGGKFSPNLKPGVYTPEAFCRGGKRLDYVLDYMADRGISYRILIVHGDKKITVDRGLWDTKHEIDSADEFMRGIRKKIEGK